MALQGWFSDKTKKPEVDEYNRTLRADLENQKRQIAMELAEAKRQLEEKSAETTRDLANQAKAMQDREAYLTRLRQEFEKGFLSGRTWLSQFVAEAESTLDDFRADRLGAQLQAAPKAAVELKKALAERREFKQRTKFLEYQLKSYKEYFPFLEDYEDLILDEGISFSATSNNLEALEKADPVLQYVERNDYEKFSPRERNQLAFDRYVNRSHSASEIGRIYERFLGYLYERDGWRVDYVGIIEGYEDLGRDLICHKGNEILIIQAKCWSAEKTIREKHIFQLFGTAQLYLMNDAQNELGRRKVSARFITTTELSPVARKAAEWLKIEVKEKFALDKAYPMIKCNINQATKEKIYHLPFDQQYDRTKIIPAMGEFYAGTVAEAEQNGFRRAFRYSGFRKQ